MKTLARSILPPSLRARVRRWRARRRIGGFGEVEPVSRAFGLERGLPVDRFYVETFLRRHAGDIRGRVLEIGDRRYTTMFGGDAVAQSDVLHAVEGNEEATFVADLTKGDELPADVYDCIVITQTLMSTYDVAAAIRTLHRLLRPGGVVLCTVPAISQVLEYDRDHWGDYWRFMPPGIRGLFEEVFGTERVVAAPMGNVLTAAGFLYGLAAEDFRPDELTHQDDVYPLVVAVRAVKAGAAA